MTDTEHTSPLTFPAVFPIKITGKATEALEEVVLAIVQATFPMIEKKDLKKRLSSNENYLAITVTVTAENQTQLDTVYQALSDAPEVIMAL